MTILELQLALNILGGNPKLKEDGLSGKNTTNAIIAFQKKNALNPDGLVGKFTLQAINAKLIERQGNIITPERSNFAYLKKGGLLTNNTLRARYGEPCNSANFITIDLPFPMKLSWETKTIITKVLCHKKIADKLKKALTEVLEAYGIEKIKALGIDLYGGMYNCRKMRTSNAYSVHSWGLALDLDPERNGLNTPFLKSEFSKLHYKQLHEIMYKNGFVNLGIEANMDSMHYQIAS